MRAALDAGPFTSAGDVIHRAGLGEAELRALAAAGAFRSLIPGGRREALWEILGRLRLLRTGGPLAPPVHIHSTLPALSDAGETIADHHATGFTLRGHPMRHLRERLAGLGVQPIEALRAAGRRDGERVRVAGLVIVRQRPGTAKGFVFVGIEDETGRLDVIVSPTLYAQERETINGSGILAVLGRLGVEDGVVNLRAERFYPLQIEDAQAVVPSHDYH